MAFVVIRCFILYFVAVIAVRIMGKRQIGELQPSELVITMLISELASMPIQDTDQPILAGILPILTLATIEIAISIITLKSVKSRQLFYGKPIILIEKGKILQREMERARVTVDDVIEAMRTNGIATIKDIEYAVLETNGNISVIQTGCDEMPDILVIDGRMIDKKIKAHGYSNDWIDNILAAQGLKSVKDVFLLAVDSKGKTYIVKKEKKD